MHLTQLSYSVNAVLTEVAVRDSEGGLPAEAGAAEPKHERKKTSVPQETPNES